MDSITSYAKIYPSTAEEIGIDFTQSLSAEVCLKIFSTLNRGELTKTSIANKAWRILASDEALWNALSLSEMAYGKTAWKKDFGVDVGEEPPLPLGINKILKSSCPFWPLKKVQETHTLVLVPEMFDGEPLTLNSLGKLMEKPIVGPKEGYETKCRYLWNEIIEKHGQATFKSHWVLMTKDVIEGSRNKSYSSQQASLAELVEKSKIGYEVPTIRDAAVCLLTEFIRSGNYLSNNESPTYTRCQEELEGQQARIGGSPLQGLIVRSDRFGHKNTGLAVLRKFF